MFVLVSVLGPAFSLPPSFHSRQTCKDFRACRWEVPLTATGTSLAKHLDALNDTLGISDIPHWVSLQDINQVITVSHFLPRYCTIQYCTGLCCGFTVLCTLST